MTCVSSGLLNAVICRSADKNKKKTTTAVLSLLLPLFVSSVFLAAGSPHLAQYHARDVYDTPARSGRSLMHWNNRIININDKVYVAGYIFGVFSAAFYVLARVPQIVKNVRRILLNPPPSLSLSLSLSPLSLAFLSPLQSHKKTCWYTHIMFLTVFTLLSGRSLYVHVHSLHPWQCHIRPGHPSLLS